MAHFAELNENNIVVNIIKVDNSILLNNNNEEEENLGINFLKNIYGENKIFIQCSYNHNFRDIFPEIGDVYDKTKNIFITKRLHNLPAHWKITIPEELFPVSANNIYLDNCDVQK